MITYGEQLSLIILWFSNSNLPNPNLVNRDLILLYVFLRNNQLLSEFHLRFFYLLFPFSDLELPAWKTPLSFRQQNVIIRKKGGHHYGKRNQDFSHPA